jgi:hypothetical protein
MLSLGDRGRISPNADHQKELVKLFLSLSGRHSHWQVFSDFCEMMAIALSNAVDIPQREAREARYMQVIKAYNKTELETFAHGMAHLTLAMDNEIRDVLGRTYHDLELHNKWAGQYFTPYDVSRMMAQMTIGSGDDLKARIEERGFVTAQEPAVGSGAMVIALAHEMREAGINYQQHLHVTAIDIDPKCVHMSYIQFSLLHIPAVIIHGDTLALKEYSHWYTPAHFTGMWQWRLRRKADDETKHEVQAPPTFATTPANTDTRTETVTPRGQLKLF